MVHVVAGQGGDPAVAQGIEIWCRKNISEWIVVHQHSEWPVLQVFPELFRNCQLKSRNSNLDEWYLASPPFSSQLPKVTGCHLPSVCF